MSSASLRKLQFAIRSRAGAQAFWGNPVNKIESISSETARAILYSKDGSLFAVVNQENITIYSTEKGDVVNTIDRPGVSAVAFSPENRFLVTWERLDEEKKDGGNLIIWKLETKEIITRFLQKNLSDVWPTIKWTDDEVYFARVIANEVRFYAAKSATPGETARLLQLPNVAHMEFAPGNQVPYTFAAFVPEKKGSPASARVYKLHAPGGSADLKVVSTKSFFKSTSAELLWNSTGNSLLVSTATEVDNSGKSYYGETGLYFLSSDGSFECNVTLQKEGPIHDVQWSPTGKQFIATYGFMPAQSTLFDSKCNPIADFGSLPRNTIRWAPNGKLVCIAGFGNLQGQMDIWDTVNFKKIGGAQAHCAAVCEWAPDSRHIITGVVSPRIRVDNGLKIFKYDGTLLYEVAITELYQVVWRTTLPGVFTDRPLTPPKEGAGAAASTSAAVATTSAPAKYQHPNAKFASSNSSVREDTGLKKYKSPEEAKAEKLPPGWVEDDKKKKKKKKGAGEKEKDGATTKTTTTGFEQPEVLFNFEEPKKKEKNKKPSNAKNNNNNNKGKGKEKEKEAEADGDAEADGEAAAEETGGMAEEERKKKVAALHKKLKAIEVTKKKKEEGATLNAAEETKIAGEEAVKKELKLLEKSK